MLVHHICPVAVVCEEEECAIEYDLACAFIVEHLEGLERHLLDEGVCERLAHGGLISLWGLLVCIRPIEIFTLQRHRADVGYIFSRIRTVDF